MKGDTNKPQSRFGRWVDWFWDGNFRKTKKGKKKVPSQHTLKKYERRWRRRKEKRDIENE